MGFVLLLWLGLAPQAGPNSELEQLIWTCPLHREITEDAPGQCEICARDLVQALISVTYSCPIHSIISQDAPGECPICRRTLYLASAELAYACPMHPEERHTSPGPCPICGMALEPETSIRPHQDHNPKHGGLFFMAPDNWHHLEGVYPEPGRFRVYLYDNFSQPLDPRGFEARAVLEETFDASTRTTEEIVAFPLEASADGAYLEALVGEGDFPREITAKIRFEPEGEFERFDFIFPDLSRDDGPEPPAVGVNTEELTIPETAEGIVAAIVERNERVGELVRAGSLGVIYLPALEAKDLAVALEARVASGNGMPPSPGALQWALKQLVRSAWLLDGFGDLGDRKKVGEAYALFDEAARALRALYDP